MQVSYGGKTFDVAAEPADFWRWVNEGRYNSEWRALSQHLKPEHTFLDLGAWVGSHSLLASTLCKRVVAVEPDPVAFSILVQNLVPLIAANQKVSPWRSAIVGSHGKVTLGSGLLGASTTRLNPNAGGGIGAWEEGQTFLADGYTLSEFAKEADLQDPLFIKMDVEGAEEEILQDTEWFLEHAPTIYLERHQWWWKDVPATLAKIEKIQHLLVGK